MVTEIDDERKCLTELLGKFNTLIGLYRENNLDNMRRPVEMLDFPKSSIYSPSSVAVLV